MKDEQPDMADLAVKRARALIDERFSDKLDIDTLCDEAHLSRFHFIRTFRSRLSETPHQYLVRKRIDRARELLARSDMSSRAAIRGDSSRRAAGRCSVLKVSNFREALSALLRYPPGHEEEAMNATISHINLFVRDQKKAYEVYVNKLGFKVNTDVTMDSGMRWLTVSPPDRPDIEILLTEPCTPMMKEEMANHIRAVLDADAMPGGVWNTVDCEKAYDEMKRKGIEFLKKPTKEFYGIEALFRDGCGNWFSLTQRPKE